MIKQLKQHDVQTTPFIATRDWNLLNTQHQDVIELTGYADDTEIIIEFIDYSIGNPYGVLNTGCTLALEQQTADPVIYEEGISGSGFFYPSEPKNLTGTYKRLVYQQILKAFYNNYQNPLQMFGLEQIDFQTSGIQKYLSNNFRIFTLPQQNFGDKIMEGSVTFVDNSFDDNYTVEDDKNGNLLAYPNLFSKSQEVRAIPNVIVQGTNGYTCPPPITTIPTDPTFLTASVLSYSGSYLHWNDSSAETGFYIFRSANSGSTWVYIGSTGQNITSSYDLNLVQTSSFSYRVQAFNPIGVSGYSNTSSISTPVKS